jgi:hypothetical protein
MSKKTFKETKIGAFLSSKAPKVLAALGDVLPNQGTLGVVKNLISSDNKIKAVERASYETYRARSYRDGKCF